MERLSLFHSDTLSQWNSEYLKYKLIPLAQVLYLHVSPLIKHHSFNNFTGGLKFKSEFNANDQVSSDFEYF